MLDQWAGLLALLLVVTGGAAYAAFNPIGSDGDIDACYERKSGDLDIQKGKRCGRGEKRVSWSQAGPQGTQGLPGTEGQQGTPGLQGAPGSDAGSALLGGSADVLSSTMFSVLAPVGDSTPVTGGIIAPRDMFWPNATLVARDLFVRVGNPPGAGKSWVFKLKSTTNVQELSCSISNTDSSCDSGAATITVPARTQIYFTAAPTGAPTVTQVDFGWRTVSP